MIGVEQVTKTYGPFTAVDDVSFTAGREVLSIAQTTMGLPRRRLGKVLDVCGRLLTPKPACVAVLVPS
jgi:ABC-type Na+ transport system ATPase subunit NatA